MTKSIKANKKISKSRGAISRQVKPSKTFDRERFFPIFSVLMSVVMLSLLGYAIYKGGDILLSKPVERVVVNGEFLHVRKQVIIEEVEPFLEAGFIQLDLNGIHQKLLELPWVYDVVIERYWPGEIAIKVIEQTPIARWGNTGFLNHRGDLFKPSDIGSEMSLPVLGGPDEEAGRVMSYFRELNVVLATKQLALNELQLNARGNWSAELDNHISIQFGGGEVMQKMQRLLFAFDTGLSNDFNRIKNIDMRYSNGFAVSWMSQKS